MTDRASCLQMIGEITVQWSLIEANLRELLWIYVGTDRPTFDILFGKTRGIDIELQLRRIVTAKEIDSAAQHDAIQAVDRSSIIRENRNTILHKMSVDHVADVASLHPKLEKARNDTIAHVEVLQECRRRLTVFVTAREAIETPDGDLDYPTSDMRGLVYLPIDWPPRTAKLALE